MSFLEINVQLSIKCLECDNTTYLLIYTLYTNSYLISLFVKQYKFVNFQLPFNFKCLHLPGVRRSARVSPIMVPIMLVKIIKMKPARPIQPHDRTSREAVPEYDNTL